jgi:hypothetical protein
MKLSPASVDRFYSIFDPLMIYANEALGLNECIFRANGDMNCDVRSNVSFEVWRDTSIIEEFADVNPVGLPKRDLDVLHSWCSVLFDHMPYRVRPDGAAEFLYEGHLFVPCGLTCEISQMLKSDMGMAELALLPFDGLVVFGTAISEFPISMGAGMRAIVEKDFSEARAKGNVVSSAASFAVTVPLLRERRIRTEAEELIEDTEYDLNPPTSFPGVHRGPLADIDPSKHEELIEAEIARSLEDDLSDTSISVAAENLRNRCSKKPEASDFATLASMEKNSALENVLRGLGAPRSSGMNKAQLVDGIAKMLDDPQANVDWLLRDLPSGDFPFLKRLVEEGRIELKYDEVKSLAGIMRQEPLLAYWFDLGECAVCIMPDKVREVLRHYDIDAKLSRQRKFDDLVNVAELLTQTRGIVLFEDAVFEYNRLYPENGIDHADQVETLFERVRNNFLSCETFVSLEGNHDAYLVDSTLLDQREKVDGKLRARDGVCAGKLGMLEDLLDAQRKTEPWPLPDALVQAKELDRWALTLPSARAFVQFLNENIPDGEDDYLFADDAFFEIVTYAPMGIEPTFLVQMLADRGLAFDDMRHMNEMLGKLFNLINDLPCWPNNGWPPSALHARATGKPEFRNEDGSVMKVGRNDPCPCGSGKKYKKCCGR